MNKKLAGNCMMTKAISVAIIIILLCGCGTTKMTLYPSFGFKIKPSEKVVAWVNDEGLIDDYWTAELKAMLTDNNLNVVDHIDFQETAYVNMIINTLTDSASLVRMRELTGINFLLIGDFGQKSKNNGIGYSLVSPGDQIYRSEKFNRWRRFDLTVYNLATGKEELFLTTTTSTRGYPIGGNTIEYDDDEHRIYLISDHRLMKKCFKKSIKKISD